MSGNPTYDTWGTAGGSAGYGTVSNSTYYSNGLWIGTTGDPVISGIIGDYLLPALTVWAWDAGDDHKQGQSSKFDFEIVWCASNSCAGLNPSDPDEGVNFIYYPDYPVVNESATVTLTAAQQSVIQQNALNSLKLAFSGYNVTVGQGRQAQIPYTSWVNIRA